MGNERTDATLIIECEAVVKACRAKDRYRQTYDLMNQSNTRM